MWAKSAITFFLKRQVHFSELNQSEILLLDTRRFIIKYSQADLKSMFIIVSFSIINLAILL